MHSAMAMLFLITYVFLLRLPSEALPIEVGRVPGKHQQAVLEMDDGKLVLTLLRRKNRPAGSRLERTCWCRESCRTCPVHVLGPAVRDIRTGTALFGGFTAAEANSALKDMLGKIGVAKAKEYRTHDIRRGHARDLQLSGVLAYIHRCVVWFTLFCVCAGAPLWKILAAGEWRSPAFLEYMDIHRLENDVVVQACSVDTNMFYSLVEPFHLQAHADESGSDSD